MAETTQDDTTIRGNDPRIGIMGRSAALPNGSLEIGYPGVSLRLRLMAHQLSLRAFSSNGKSRLLVRVNGHDQQTLELGQQATSYELYQLAPGKEIDVMEVELVHLTETWIGVVTVEAFEMPQGGALLELPAPPERKLLFIGDSVTCGEAVEREPGCEKNPRWWNPPKSFGMLIGMQLHAQVHLVCYGGRGLIRDWEGRSDTLTAPQFFELAVPKADAAPTWDHSQYQPDAIMIALGTNDFNLAIGALPEKEAYVAAYTRFVKRIRQVHPSAEIFLTDGPIVNDTTDPARPQKRILRDYLYETELQARDEGLRITKSAHHPGDDCDPHPTRQQHEMMAASLGESIREVFGW